MEFLWVWAYNLAGPLSYVCMGGLVICLIIFAQSMKLASQSSRSASLGAVYGAFVIGGIWALLSSVPSPTYDQKIIYKDRVKVVEKPVVKRVIKMRQTITKTITKIPDRDARIRQCFDEPNNSMSWNECTTWAIRMEKPRIIEKRINVIRNVYKGIKVVEKVPSYDARLDYCVDKGNNYFDCAKSAREASMTVRVVKVPSKYLDIFKYCNENFSLDGVPNAAQVRNERLKICTETAERGSR